MSDPTSRDKSSPPVPATGPAIARSYLHPDTRECRTCRAFGSPTRHPTTQLRSATTAENPPHRGSTHPTLPLPISSRNTSNSSRDLAVRPQDPSLSAIPPRSDKYLAVPKNLRAEDGHPDAFRPKCRSHCPCHRSDRK